VLAHRSNFVKKQHKKLSAGKDPKRGDSWTQQLLFTLEMRAGGGPNYSKEAVSVKGLAPGKQIDIGPGQWYVCVGHQGKGVKVRSGAELTSAQVCEAVPGTLIRVDAMNEIDSKMRSQIAEPFQGWVSSDFIECVSHRCEHCHVCGGISGVSAALFAALNNALDILGEVHNDGCVHEDDALGAGFDHELWDRADPRGEGKVDVAKLQEFMAVEHKKREVSVPGSGNEWLHDNSDAMAKTVHNKFGAQEKDHASVEEALKTLEGVHTYISELQEDVGGLTKADLIEVQTHDFNIYQKMDPNGKGYVTQEMFLHYFNAERMNQNKEKGGSQKGDKWIMNMATTLELRVREHEKKGKLKEGYLKEIDALMNEAESVHDRLANNEHKLHKNEFVTAMGEDTGMFRKIDKSHDKGATLDEFLDFLVSEREKLDSDKAGKEKLGPGKEFLRGLIDKLTAHADECEGFVVRFVIDAKFAKFDLDVKEDFVDSVAALMGIRSEQLTTISLVEGSVVLTLSCNVGNFKESRQMMDKIRKSGFKEGITQATGMLVAKLNVAGGVKELAQQDKDEVEARKNFQRLNDMGKEVKANIRKILGRGKPILTPFNAI